MRITLTRGLFLAFLFPTITLIVYLTALYSAQNTSPANQRSLVLTNNVQNFYKLDASKKEVTSHTLLESRQDIKEESLLSSNSPVASRRDVEDLKEAFSNSPQLHTILPPSTMDESKQTLSHSSKDTILAQRQDMEEGNKTSLPASYIPQSTVLPLQEIVSYNFGPYSGKYFEDACKRAEEQVLECSLRPSRPLTPLEASGGDILFTVRTTVKYHAVRLPDILETWLSGVDPAGVYIVSDGKDEDLEKKLGVLGHVSYNYLGLGARLFFYCGYSKPSMLDVCRHLYSHGNILMQPPGVLDIQLTDEQVFSLLCVHSYRYTRKSKPLYWVSKCAQ